MHLNIADFDVLDRYVTKGDKVHVHTKRPAPPQVVNDGAAPYGVPVYIGLFACGFAVLDAKKNEIILAEILSG